MFKLSIDSFQINRLISSYLHDLLARSTARLKKYGDDDNYNSGLSGNFSAIISISLPDESIYGYGLTFSCVGLGCNRCLASPLHLMDHQTSSSTAQHREVTQETRPRFSAVYRWRVWVKCRSSKRCNNHAALSNSTLE